MHVLVGGGTGYIGVPLVNALLAAGHSVTVVSRSASKVGEVFRGNAAAATLESLPAQFDVAVSLSGENVSRRWNRRVKREILESRVNATRAIRQAAENAGARALVAASAVGFYGDTGAAQATEDSPPGKGFLADVCVQWESAAQSSKLRVAVVRVGFVIGPESKAIQVMAPPFRMFVGGPLAGGRQYVPWVHQADVVAMFRWAVENEAVSGPVNAIAPAPATNRDISNALARALHRPSWFPVPGFAVKLLFGEMGGLALESQHVTPARALALGFKFTHTDLDRAMRDSV
jgi:uncharacterized protein (TIGR01777 family)